MTFSAPQPVVSGHPYRVTSPQSPQLANFIGDTSFVLDLDGVDYRVCGTGRAHEDGVRFYQKDHEGTGKDVRVWFISELSTPPGVPVPESGQDLTGQFVAEQICRW